MRRDSQAGCRDMDGLSWEGTEYGSSVRLILSICGCARMYGGYGCIYGLLSSESSGRRVVPSSIATRLLASCPVLSCPVQMSLARSRSCHGRDLVQLASHPRPPVVITVTGRNDGIPASALRFCMVPADKGSRRGTAKAGYRLCCLWIDLRPRSQRLGVPVG